MASNQNINISQSNDANAANNNNVNNNNTNTKCGKDVNCNFCSQTSCKNNGGHYSQVKIYILGPFRLKTYF